MLHHRPEVVLQDGAEVGDAGVGQEPVEAVVGSHALDDIRKGQCLVCRAIGRWVVDQAVESEVFGASQAQRLRGHPLALKLVGVRQMDKGMADWFTC